MVTDHKYPFRLPHAIGEGLKPTGSMLRYFSVFLPSPLAGEGLGERGMHHSFRCVKEMVLPVARTLLLPRISHR